MMDAEIVIPRFGHNVKLASTVGATPGGSHATGQMFRAPSTGSQNYFKWSFEFVNCTFSIQTGQYSSDINYI